MTPTATGRWKIDPGGRTHHLGVVQVDAAAGEDHGVGAGRIRCPDDGARVAGVTHLLEDRNELRLVAEDDLERGGKLLAHGDDALRGHRVSHRLEYLLGDELDLEVGVSRARRDLRVTIEGRGCREQVDEELRSERERFAHRLGTLEQEETGVSAVVLLAELGHAADAWRPRVIDHGSDDRCARHAAMVSRAGEPALNARNASTEVEAFLDEMLRR